MFYFFFVARFPTGATISMIWKIENRRKDVKGEKKTLEDLKKKKTLQLWTTAVVKHRSGKRIKKKKKHN